MSTDPGPDLPVPTFGWSDMWASPEEDPRSEGGPTDERSLLLRYLANYRLTLELKCSGLDADQLARRSVPPSSMSLLGLVRHLATVEQYWFRVALAGEEVERLYRGEGNDEFDDAVGDPACVDAAWSHWRTETAYADAFIAAHDLDSIGAGGAPLGGVVPPRVEESPRHSGHADLLRER